VDHAASPAFPTRLSRMRLTATLARSMDSRRVISPSGRAFWSGVGHALAACSRATSRTWAEVGNHLQRLRTSGMAWRKAASDTSCNSSAHIVTRISTSFSGGEFGLPMRDFRNSALIVASVTMI
jgi:hypothetical protein